MSGALDGDPLLSTLLVMSLVALLVVVLLWRTDRDESAAGDRALARIAAGKAAEKAARTAVVRMTSYDYRTVDKDFGWVEDAGTARFQKQYAEVSAPIKRLVVRLRAHAEGSVVASAPVVADTRHVTVLLFVDQAITNPGSTKMIEAIAPADEHTVCTILFSRMLDPEKSPRSAIEITAAGMDVANVRPTFRPR